MSIHTTAHEENLPGYKHRWLALVFIGISLLVISMDNTILNVALPAIATDLEASASELQWIVDAYVVVFAALLLTMGAVSDRVGRKRSLQFGLVWFVVGSVAAALSETTEMLIASRAFLGFGGAIIMPSTLSIISASFPREERAQAFAIWAAVFGLGIGLGPVIGGWLLEQFDGWGAVFMVNLPVVAVAITGGAIYIAESRDEHAPALDIGGVILSASGLFALVYGIIEAGELGWAHSEVLLAFSVAAVLLGLFAWWENRNPNAMLPLSFFRNMSFTGANIAMVLVTFSLFGTLFFVSQFLQSVLGYSALESGLRLLPLTLMVMVTAASSAKLADRIGTKLTVTLGVFVVGCALLWMSSLAAVEIDYTTLALNLMLLGFGIGCTMSPATNSIMQSVPVNKAGIGSAMNDTTRQLGGALGVAVLGTIMNNIYIDRIDSLKATLVNLPDEVFGVIESSIQAAHGVARALPDVMAQNTEVQLPANVIESAQTTIVQAANEAFVAGMADALVVAAVIMFVAAGLTFVLLPVRVIPPQEDQSPSISGVDSHLGHSLASE